jgi:Uncharacterised nucleotidyltransferase
VTDAPTAGDPVRHLAALLAPGGPTAPVPTTTEEWRPVLEAASRHKLVPALWSALRASGAIEPVPEQLARHWKPERDARIPVELALASSYQRNADHVASLCRQATDILSALDAAGIRAVPLKGVDAVLAGRYPDHAARTMVDADILVDPQAADAAQAVVRQLGYEPVPATASAHQLAPLIRPGQAGSVELHRALTVERWAGVVDAAAVLDRSRVVHGGRRQASRSDSAIHLVAHAHLHDEGYLLWLLPLRAAHESALMVSGREDVDWDEVARAFRGVRRRGALVNHLELTARLFGVPSPLPAGPIWGYRARATVGLDRHPRTLQFLGQVVWLPRALSPARMTELYQATDRRSIRRARVNHIRRAVLRRLRALRVDDRVAESCSATSGQQGRSNDLGPTR